MNDIDIEKLRRVVHYEPGSGRFYRRMDYDWEEYEFSERQHLQMFNKTVGGYKVARIGDHHVTAHRAAWALTYGEWPKYGLRHVNGNKADNRIGNLTDKPDPNDIVQIRRSMKTMHSNNKSGKRGVCFLNSIKKWGAYISINGKRINLGYFKNIEDAITARQIAEQQYRCDSALK